MNYQNSQFEKNDSNGNGGSEKGYQYIFSSNATHGGSNGNAPRPPKKSGVSMMVLVLSMVLCVCLSFGAGFGGAMYVEMRRNQSAEKTDENRGTEAESSSDGQEQNLLVDSPEDLLDKSETNPSIYGSAGEDAFEVSGVVRKVQDAVVVIEATVTTTSMFGQSGTSTSSGSGVVISKDGYILTCHHVVENARSVKVSLYNGDVYDASLVGSDETSDLAVLKVDPGETELVYAEQGCSGDLVVGEKVVAIGNPLGTLGGTVTTGIISATERNISMSDGTEMTLIQTDAAINSGNSGGGLLNLDGQLIGVVNAKYSASGVEGLAFAIPIDSAYVVQLDLIEFGYVRGVIDHGLSVLEVGESELAYCHYYYGLSQTGVYIVSSEYTDELKNADLIVSVNGEEVKTENDLYNLIDGKAVGDRLTFVVSRKDNLTQAWQEITVELELQEHVPDRLKDSLNDLAGLFAERTVFYVPYFGCR